MALTVRDLEEIATWCQTASELAGERRQAWQRFFGEDDPRPTNYWPGAGDHDSRARRFLGWFMFDHELAEGERPAAHAARALYSGVALDQALRALGGARFLLAIALSVIPGRSVLLELEHQRFEVRDRRWSRLITPGASVVAHLVPTGRRGEWLPGPGWLEWPIRIGPNMRRDLHKVQMDPLALERLLQSRERPEEERRPVPPQDATLEEAVARMSAAAREAGLTRLDLPAAQWEALVLEHLGDADALAFTREIVERVGDAKSVEDLNRWIQLGMNIWNATPQPDRGGKTAYELSRSRTGMG